MGSLYGAAVAMATYMEYTTLFRKKYMCLGLCHDIKAVTHKYQSMQNISNLEFFFFFFFFSIINSIKYT